MRLIFLGVLLTILVFPGCREEKAPSPPPLPASPETNPETVSPPEDSRPQDEEKPRPLQRPVDRTPRETLEKTVAAYKKARTYSDHGRVRIVGRMTDPEAEPASWPCTVALRKPGHLRVEVHEGMLVSDGEDVFAQVRPLENQVLRFPTPETWSLETLFRDLELDRAMDLGLPETILRFPPQLILLFADDPLRTLLPDGATAEFLDPQWLKDLPCDLIRITHPTGNRILWIGRDDGALLRFDYQVEGLPVPEGVESIRLIRIDLGDAGFDREIAPEAFRMLQPAGARQVEEFQPAEALLLGQTPEEPETLKMQPIVDETESDPRAETLADLNDKTVALCFWTTGSEPSGAMLAEMDKVRVRFSEDDRVRFFAVNLDDLYPEKPDGPSASRKPPVEEIEQSVRKAFSEQNFSVPVRLDVEGRLSAALGVDSIPTFVVLAPGNRIEFYYRGVVPETLLDGLLRDVLAGGKPHEKERNLFVQLRDEHRAELHAMAESGVFAAIPKPVGPELRLSPAPPKEPATFSLEERWSLNSLQSPGNVAVLAGGPAKVLIPCEGNMLAVIDASGKMLRKEIPPGLNPDELLTLVRADVDGNGRCLVGVSSVGGHTVHVFDETLKPVFSYPVEGNSPGASAEPPRRIVSDFRFVDLRGNGTPALLLGLIGIAPSPTGGDALLAVGLQGGELWRDETVSSPFLIHSTVVRGKRNVYSLNVRDGRSMLLKFDADGKRLKPLEMESGTQILWFDVTEEDEPPVELGVILADAEGRNIRFAGLDGEGEVLWQHSLPMGDYRKPIELMIAGNLTGGARKEWLVPAPDGEVFVFEPSGTLLDSFAFGVFPTGMAVIAEGSKRLLVVADDQAVTGWDVVEYSGKAEESTSSLRDPRSRLVSP